MRTPQEIINELKHVTYWSQPNLKYEETMNLLHELETTLFPVEEVIIVETPIVEEPVVEEVVTEEITIEDIQAEEPVVETTPTKTTRKK